MTDIENLDQMTREWRIWRAFCKELEARLDHDIDNLDLNDDSWNPVFRAAESWGEELAALRLEQEPETRDRVRDERRVNYEAVRTVTVPHGEEGT